MPTFSTNITLPLMWRPLPSPTFPRRTFSWWWPRPWWLLLGDGVVYNLCTKFRCFPLYFLKYKMNGINTEIIKKLLFKDQTQIQEKLQVFTGKGVQSQDTTHTYLTHFSIFGRYTYWNLGMPTPGLPCIIFIYLEYTWKIIAWSHQPSNLERL